MKICFQTGYYPREFYLLPTISIVERSNGFYGIIFTIGCKAWGIGIIINKEDKEE